MSSSSPIQEGGDVADLTILQLRLVELLTWGMLVAIIRTIVLYITFALFIIIAATVTGAALFVQYEYPVITADIAADPLLNEIATISINTIIDLINATLRIIDFLIEAWDYVVGILYMVGEMLYHAIEDFLQVVFGTPKLQCIIADVFDFLANLVGQIFIGIKLVFESTQRTLQLVDDTVPPLSVPEESAPPAQKKAYCERYAPSLTEIDVSGNRQGRVAFEADPQNHTIANFNASAYKDFCSPQGGVNPAYDGGEKEKEQHGQCPSQSKVLIDILKLTQVLIEIIVEVLEYVIPIAVALIKDAFHEIAIIVPQFISLISKIINELKEKGVFTTLIQVVKSTLLVFYPIWNFVCPIFALVGWFICTVFSFLANLLQGFIGQLICAFDGTTSGTSLSAPPVYPSSIEASIFNNQSYEDIGAFRASRAFALTLNRPSDFNYTQSMGFFFAPPSLDTYPQRIRVDYNAVYSVPSNGTVVNETAYMVYMNHLVYLHTMYRSSVMHGVDQRTSFYKTDNPFATATSDFAREKLLDRENDTLAETNYLTLSSSSSQCTNYVVTGALQGTNRMCTNCTNDPCNIRDNTDNPYADNCNCKQFCNPNIMTNAGLPAESLIGPNNASWVCDNPTGVCDRLPGQLCPTSSANTQTPGFCSDSGKTGNNQPGPCYNTVNQGDIRGSSVNYKGLMCGCDGSDECGGSSSDIDWDSLGCNSVGDNDKEAPNLNGPTTCYAPRTVMTVSDFFCACITDYGTYPCFYGGYYCINWSTSAFTFKNTSVPPTVVPCVGGEKGGNPYTFLKALTDCFKDGPSPQSIYGADDDDGDFTCGSPLNPSTLADDGDLSTLTGLNFSDPGDTPAASFPKSDTFALDNTGDQSTDPPAGYCPAGQNGDGYECNFPPGVPTNVNKCNTTFGGGGATNQADPSRTGIGANQTGTRCKAILQMCSCLKPFNGSNVTDPLFSVVKCEIKALEEITEDAANLAKNIFNLTVDLFRALPQLIRFIIQFIESLALDGLKFLEEFAKQVGVVFTTLQNTATLSGGIGEQMRRLEQSETYKQFLNTTSGKMLSMLSSRKIASNATCDAACLNGTGAPGCILSCPRTTCFLSGTPSLCCFPGPAPATVDRTTTQSNVNLTNASDATSGLGLDDVIGTSRKYCVLGTTTPAPADYGNVKMRFAGPEYTPPTAKRMLARMVQQMIALQKNKPFSQLLNQTDLIDAIDRLQDIYDLMTGATQIYTPERDDVESMPSHYAYDENGDYRYVYDPLGIRSQLGLTMGAIIGSNAQHRWAEFMNERERTRLAREAAQPDLSDAAAPGAAASSPPADCPQGDANLTAYCTRAGTRDPCCRCMVINGQCRASPKSPYCCCSKDSSAYECCKGLPGCIPPIFKNIRLSRITNVDFLKFVNRETCAPFNTGVKELLAIVRWVMGDFVHKFIAAADTEAQRNFYQFFIGWLEFPDGNSLPAFAYLCFILNIGRFLLLLLIVFLIGLVYIGFAPLLNELWEVFTEEAEELQIIAGQQAAAAGGGLGMQQQQQSISLGAGTTATSGISVQ